MPTEPASLNSDNPGLPVFEGLVDCLNKYPLDAEMIAIKASVDANPDGLPYHTLLGLFCLASARCAILGAASAGTDFEVVQDLDVGRDISVGRNSAIVGTQSVGGLSTLASMSVTGAATLNGTVTAPGITAGTYVGGRPAVFRNPSTNQLYTAVPTSETPTNIKTRYIAARSDGIAGQGTENDPFDGSTAAKIATLWPLLPTNTDIVFARGTYDLNAYYDFGSGRKACLPLSTGQNIICDGGVTLRLAANQLTLANTRVDIIASLTDGAGHTVRGLTIDGNRANQSAYTGALSEVYLYAVNLLGFEGGMVDLLVKGTWNSGSGENFPVIAASNTGTWALPARWLIDNVTVQEHEGFSTLINLLGTSDVSGATGRSFTGASSGDVITLTAHGYSDLDTVFILTKTGGSGVTLLQRYFVRNKATNTFQLSLEPDGAILALGSDLDPGTLIRQTWVTGAIRNCKVIGAQSGAYSTEQGIGCGGWKDMVVENNALLDVFSGVFTDTHCYEGVQVHGNTIRLRADPTGNAASGVFAGGGFRWKDWSITDNTFILSRNSIGVRLGSSVGNVQGCLIARNRFYKNGDLTGSGTAWSALSLDLTGNTNIRLEDNQLDPGVLVSGVPALGSRLTWSSRNRLFDGTTAALPESLNTALAFDKTTLYGWADGGTSTQTIATAATDAFDISTVRTDTGTFFDTTTNRVTVNAAGLLRLIFQVKVNSITAGGGPKIGFRKNGSTAELPWHSLDAAAVQVAGTRTIVTGPILVAASDYFDAFIFNDSGANIVISKAFQDSAFWYEFTPL